MKHNVWTKPNSLMIVKADSYKHGVKPVTKGTREILKMIYTPTHTINEKNKRLVIDIFIMVKPSGRNIKWRNKYNIFKYNPHFNNLFCFMYIKVKLYEDKW